MNVTPRVLRRIEGRTQHVMVVLPTAILDLTPRQAERLRDDLDRASILLPPCRFCPNLAEWGGLCGPCSDAADDDRSAL